MWSMVAQRLTQITSPAATPDQLWQRVEAAWSAVPQEHIQSFFESIPRRVAARRTKYVSNMSKNGLKQISQEMSFQWYFMTSPQVNWADIENCVEFLSEEMLDIKIDDNGLFEEERRQRMHS
ncbi:transposable element Tcb1 transposase [Trichonephila clavipes]|nr:transposable element Tcb1 transposase [Trichonephila clavipes]